MRRVYGTQRGGWLAMAAQLFARVWHIQKVRHKENNLTTGSKFWVCVFLIKKKPHNNNNNMLSLWDSQEASVKMVNYSFVSLRWNSYATCFRRLKSTRFSCQQDEPFLGGRGWYTPPQPLLWLVNTVVNICIRISATSPRDIVNMAAQLLNTLLRAWHCHSAANLYFFHLKI